MGCLAPALGKSLALPSTVSAPDPSLVARKFHRVRAPRAQLRATLRFPPIESGGRRARYTYHDPFLGDPTFERPLDRPRDRLQPGRCYFVHHLGTVFADDMRLDETRDLLCDFFAPAGCRCAASSLVRRPERRTEQQLLSKLASRCARRRQNATLTLHGSSCLFAYRLLPTGEGVVLVKPGKRSGVQRQPIPAYGCRRRRPQPTTAPAYYLGAPPVIPTRFSGG